MVQYQISDFLCSKSYNEIHFHVSKYQEFILDGTWEKRAKSIILKFSVSIFKCELEVHFLQI